jgi:hypothetical protein
MSVGAESGHVEALDLVESGLSGGDDGKQGQVVRISLILENDDAPPLFPPSDPAPRLLQGPPAKSKFLAAHIPGAPGEGHR